MEDNEGTAKEEKGEQKNLIIVIFGKKGSGKTNLTKYLLSKTSSNKSLFIWDFLGEYGDYGYVFTDVIELLKYLKGHKPPYKIVFQSDNLEDFDKLCQIVYKVGNTILMIEETDAICNPTSISQNFAYIIRYGRHFNIDIIGITRRPYEINRLLTAQADKLFVFQFNEPRDLTYLKAFMPSDITHRIKTLPRFNFICYDTVSSEILQNKAPLM